MFKPEEISEFLTYVDLFGTKFTFYTQNTPKFYTPSGGILTIFSLIACIFIFIFPNLRYFKRENPIISKSYISKWQHKIKFGEEKIWIPWRISNNNSSFINHTNKFFPIINYYFSENLAENKKHILKSKSLTYKLCNETSMINKPNIYYLNIPLNELYCIDMDDILIGGSWITDFIYYLEFDLFLCKNGENYNENNINCIFFENLTNYGKNTYDINIYYPTVQFQPTNISTPVTIIYKEYFYHLSKYTNKITRIYLQKYILNDNTGIFISNKKNNTYWGLKNIDSDFYLNSEQNNNINEDKTSKIFSFNIYLEPGIIYYRRYYKNFFDIIGYSFPIIFVVHSIFKNIAKFIKVVTINKTITELLFEKTMVVTIDKEKEKNKEDEKDKDIKKSIFDFKKSVQGTPKSRRRRSVFLQNSNFSSLAYSNIGFMNNNQIETPEMLNKKKLSSNVKNVIDTKLKYGSKKNNAMKISIINSDFYLKNRKNKIKSKKTFIPQIKKEMDSQIINNNDFNSRQNISSSEIISKNLFPFKYYFCLLFIRNISLQKQSTFFSNKFKKVQIFLRQMFDVSSYITLYIEFNKLKRFIDKPVLKAIEKKNRISLFGTNLNKEMSEDFNENKARISRKNISSNLIK